MEITITLTETEYNALSRVCADPQEWAENAVKERARVATEDIVAEQVRAMLANPEVTTMPATVEEIIANAPEPVIAEPIAPEESVVVEAVAKEIANPVAE